MGQATKKFLLGTIILVIILIVTWYYLPPDSREKAALFFGLSPVQNVNEIKGMVIDKVLAEDPAKKRAVLLAELKKNIEVLKNHVSISGSPASLQNKNKVNAVSGETSKLIISSENIIQQLEEVNKGDSGQKTIVSRILDTILPSATKSQCDASVRN